MMVLCFLMIDLVMLVIFSIVEGVSGDIGAKRVPDKERSATTVGVSHLSHFFYLFFLMLSLVKFIFFFLVFFSSPFSSFFSQCTILYRIKDVSRSSMCMCVIPWRGISSLEYSMATKPFYRYIYNILYLYCV